MNYFVGITELLLSDTYISSLVTDKDIQFWWSNIDRMKSQATPYTSRITIVIDEEGWSSPITDNNWCIIYQNSTISVSVIFGSNDQYNDIWTAKKIRDKIIILLNNKRQLMKWTDIVWKWHIKFSSDIWKQRDDGLNLWMRGSTFDIVRDPNCTIWIC